MTDLPVAAVRVDVARARGVPPETVHLTVEAEEMRRGRGVAFVTVSWPTPTGRMETVPLVAKRYRDHAEGARAFEVLRRLREDGLGDASPYRVVRPVAWCAGPGVLVMTRAAGTRARDDAWTRRGSGVAAAAGAWLAHLHRTRVPDPATAPVTFGPDDAARLADAVAAHAPDLAMRAADAAAQIRDPPPCAVERFLHGDYHLGNVFVAADGTVTGIDVDQAGRGDPARDLATAIAQIVTAGGRPGRPGWRADALVTALLAAYRDAGGPRVPAGNLHWHHARALFEIMHYKCVMRDARFTDSAAPGARNALMARVEHALAEARREGVSPRAA